MVRPSLRPGFELAFLPSALKSQFPSRDLGEAPKNRISRSETPDLRQQVSTGEGRCQTFLLILVHNLFNAALAEIARPLVAQPGTCMNTWSARSEIVIVDALEKMGDGSAGRWL